MRILFNREADIHYHIYNRKMKTKSIIIVLLATAFAMTACQDRDWEVPESITSQPPYGNNSLVAGTVISIADLQSMYATIVDYDFYEQIKEDLWLRCVVTGNDMGGNIYKQITVQDKTGGIIIGINGSDQGARLCVNQKLLISLKGLYIGGYGEQAQIGAKYWNKNKNTYQIGRMEIPVWQQHVRLIMDGTPEAADFDGIKVDTVDFDANKTMAEQGGKVVRLTGVTITGVGTQVIAPDDGSVSPIGGCINRTISGGNAGASCLLRSSTYADFKGIALPKGPVDLYGIASWYGGSWQIYARTTSDLTWVK